MIPEIEKNIQPDIMTPREAARFLKRHITWVYRYREELGGIKIGGALFFPGKEEIYERLFHQRPGMEIQLLSQQDPAYFKQLLSHEKTGQAGRSKKKGGDKDSKNISDPDRHGLLGIIKQKA